MIIWASAVIRLVWESSHIAAIISRNIHTHLLCTTSWDVCVIYTLISRPFPQLLFSLLLLFVMNRSSSCLMVSQKQLPSSIAPFFNKTFFSLTKLPTSMDSSSLLYGWKQSTSKCLLYMYKLEWSVGFHLSHVGFTRSTHFVLSSRCLKKWYGCSPSQQVELQPFYISYCLDNTKTTHSSITCFTMQIR